MFFTLCFAVCTRATSGYQECELFSRSPLGQCPKGYSCCNLNDLTTQGLCCQLGKCLTKPSPIFGHVNVCTNYTSDVGCQPLKAACKTNQDCCGAAAGKASCQATAPGSELRWCVPMDEGLPPPRAPARSEDAPPQKPPPPPCRFNNSTFHDTMKFTIWDFTSAEGGNMIHGQSRNDTSQANIEIGKYVSFAGFSGHWILNAIINGTNFTGSLLGDCSMIRLFTPQPTPSGTDGFSFQQGPNPEPLGHCRFNKSLYHNVQNPQGVWSQVVRLTSLNETAFHIESLNKTIKPTTAIIGLTVGTTSLATAYFETTDGTDSGMRSFQITAESSKHPDVCQTMKLFWGGPTGHGSFDEWEMGAAPLPAQRPCSSLYTMDSCWTAWLNHCEWCRSNDGAHELCFPVTKAKALPSSWKCH